MYLVTIINNDIETVINAVSTDINTPRISGTIKQGINCIDSFTFSILPNNPGYNLIYPYKTLVKVFNVKSRKYEFIGRVLTPSGSMDSSGLISKQYICESELAYLIDSSQIYGEYHNITIEKYLEIMLNRHNLNREDHKKIYLGNVTVKDSNDSIYKYLSYDSTWKNIEEDLLDTYGGELKLRYEDDKKYLDYLIEIGEKKETEIRLGKNIKDITNDIDPTNYITRLVPLGAKLQKYETGEDGTQTEVDSEERLTIESVNNGINYIDDPEAIEEFGIIEGFVTYDDVNDVNNLFRKGKEYLASQRILVSNKVSALDLSIIGLDVDSFEVGNYYPLTHELLGINYYVRIIEKSISIENPHSSTITLGDKQKDIKQYQLDNKKRHKEAMKLAEEVKKKALQIENYAIEEVYRVDDRVNNVISSTSDKFESVSNELESLKHQVDDIKGSNYVFDVSEKNHAKYKENLALTSTSVMQSFDIDIDRNILYFSQLKANTMGDIVITKVDADTNNIIGSMELKNFGHGTNLCIEEEGLDVYIWMECNGIEHSDGRIWGNKVCRFKFENNKVYTNTCGEVFDLLPGHVGLSPSIDKDRNNLLIKSKKDGIVYFTVFDLQSVLNNKFVQIVQIKNPSGVNVISHQGHDIFKKHIYNWEGVKGDDTQQSTAYLTVFDLKGNIKYRKLIGIEPSLVYREAEGIKVKQISLDKHELYIGFAIGKSGDRKANIYKYTDTK